MKAKDYRKLAVNQCIPVSSTLAVIQLVLEALLGLLSILDLIPYVGFIFGSVGVFLVSGPFEFSNVLIAKGVKENGKAKVEDLFSGFKRFSQAFILIFLRDIFITLWSLLLIVPGIIKTYSYACATYISFEDPEIGCLDSITQSRKLMNGNKWKLFCLDISYIGWYLLGLLTLGILLLWVLPKHRQARYNFYLNLVANSKGEEITNSEFDKIYPNNSIK